MSGKVKNSHKKKIIYYILWIIILIYLYGEFLKTDPFGKNSVFSKASCKKAEKSSSNYIKIENE